MANRLTEMRGRTSKRKQATKREVQEKLSKQDTYYHLLQGKADRDTAAISLLISPPRWKWLVMLDSLCQ